MAVIFIGPAGMICPVGLGARVACAAMRAKITSVRRIALSRQVREPIVRLRARPRFPRSGAAARGTARHGRRRLPEAQTRVAPGARPAARRPRRAGSSRGRGRACRSIVAGAGTLGGRSILNFRGGFPRATRRDSRPCRWHENCRRSGRSRPAWSAGSIPTSTPALLWLDATSD